MKITRKIGYTLLVIWTSCSICIASSVEPEMPLKENETLKKQYTNYVSYEIKNQSANTPEKLTIKDWILNFISLRARVVKPRNVIEIVTIEG